MGSKVVSNLQKRSQACWGLLRGTEQGRRLASHGKQGGVKPPKKIPSLLGTPQRNRTGTPPCFPWEARWCQTSKKDPKPAGDYSEEQNRDAALLPMGSKVVSNLQKRSQACWGLLRGTEQGRRLASH